MAGEAFDAKRDLVIHNPTIPMPQFASPQASRQSGLRVVSLSHIDKGRGIDRIVDVATELAARGRRDIRF